MTYNSFWETNAGSHFQHLLVALLLTVLFSLGCSSEPEFAPEVTGKVTINGKPYPRVKVTFVPQAPDIDGAFMPTAVTDAQGNFTLSMPGDKPGCPAVQCKVTITEPSPPDDIQANMMSENPDDRLYSRYVKSLKLRPIPKVYGLLKSTPLLAEVTADEHHFEFELKK